MKRFFTLLMLAVFAFAANAQTPDVTITVTDSTTTTVTANFTPNSVCSSYFILMSTDAEMTQFAQMMQCNISDLVQTWGIAYTQADTYTWTDQTPGSEFMIYVVAIGGTDTLLLTKTAHTLPMGGTGASVLAIEVTDITEQSARVIVTPNTETSVFYDQVIQKSYYEEIGADSAMAIVQNNCYPQYVVDNWIWSGLFAETEYYALAIGQNANHEWGQMAIVPFSTLGDGIIVNSLDDLQVYPNPTSGQLHINFDQNIQQVKIVNILGQVVYNETVANDNITLNVSNWNNGVYIIRITSDKGVATQKFVKR